MALCLAESLVVCRGFDPADQMRRDLGWYRHGEWSSTGICFDIGNSVAAALRRFERDGDPFAGDTDPRAGGNGSLLRLAPIPLAFARDPGGGGPPGRRAVADHPRGPRAGGRLPLLRGAHHRRPAR